jgi:DNA repair exonuclease SbcCD ATPase subunit
MKNTIVEFSLLFMLCVLAIPSAHANNEALAKAQFMLRQAAAEKSKLTAENQKLIAENAALAKRVAELEARYEKQKSSSAKKSAAQSQRYETTLKQLNEERDAHRETSTRLKQLSQEQQRVVGIAKHQVEAIELCVNNNRKLYDINRELLGQYEEKGVWGALTQAEPFTGLKQVEIENLVDDYQYRLDDLRVDTSTMKSAQNLENVN